MPETFGRVSKKSVQSPMNRFSPRRVSGITQTALMAPFDSCHPREREVGGPGRWEITVGEVDVRWEMGGGRCLLNMLSKVFFYSFLGFWNFSTWNTFIFDSRTIAESHVFLVSINNKVRPKFYCIPE